MRLVPSAYLAEATGPVAIHSRNQRARTAPATELPAPPATALPAPPATALPAHAPRAPRASRLTPASPRFDVDGEVLKIEGVEERRIVAYLIDTIWARFPEIKEVQVFRCDQTMLCVEPRPA